MSLHVKCRVLGHGLPPNALYVPSLIQRVLKFLNPSILHFQIFQAQHVFRRTSQEWQEAHCDYRGRGRRNGREA